MKSFDIYINNKKYRATAGQTILDVAIKNDIFIPTLCYLKGINKDSNCRMCVVEIEGRSEPVTSCSYEVYENMRVLTDTDKIISSRKNTLELILEQHNQDCTNCGKAGKCELQALSVKYDVYGSKKKSRIDDPDFCIIRDYSKCILCNRCVNVCKYVQTCNVLGHNGRGNKTVVSSAFNLPLSSVKCVACGQCVRVCPTGALQERDDIKTVRQMLASKKPVIVATAPSVRVTLGEDFGYKTGENIEKKMVAGLRKLGFDKVFDVNFGADLTIIEEATELAERLNGGVLPMFTSCSPGWINFVEQRYPEFIPNLSTCKSPQGMMGSIIQNFYAPKNGLKKSDFYFVTIMPCTAKKEEILRDEYKEIDLVLTARELSRFLQQEGIDLKNLKDSDFDNPLGAASGAGAIFGTSGGVMEAALRTAYNLLTGNELDNIDFTSLRSQKGIKRATIDINGKKINVAAVSSLRNARTILEEVKSGKSNLHFVEVMACPGGCINGGGQPYVCSAILNKREVKPLRSKALYKQDKALSIRKSHLNPYIKNLYDEYLIKPGGEKAHKILHTHFNFVDKV